jgi:AraC family ethanolamine operon transcriptional activator
MATRTFTDFDAFASVDCPADGKWLLTHLAGRKWVHTHRPLVRLSVTCRHEESGSLFHGAVRPGWCVLCVETTRPPAHTLNGQRLRPDSLVVIGPGAEVYFASRGRSDWFTVAAPFELIVSQGGRRLLSPCPGANGSLVFSPPRDSLARLCRVVARLEADDRDAPWLFDNPQVVAAAESELLAAALVCLAPATRSAVPLSAHHRRNPSHGVLIRAALARLEAEPAHYPVPMASIAGAADVSERTLRSVFSDYCGVSPARYMKLRQLHLVRRALAEATPHHSTVTYVESRFGVSEFGRFAHAYRQLFGELPSQTLANVATRL